MQSIRWITGHCFTIKSTSNPSERSDDKLFVAGLKAAREPFRNMRRHGVVSYWWNGSTITPERRAYDRVKHSR